MHQDSSKGDYENTNACATSGFFKICCPNLSVLKSGLLVPPLPESFPPPWALVCLLLDPLALDN